MREAKPLAYLVQFLLQILIPTDVINRYLAINVDGGGTGVVYRGEKMKSIISGRIDTAGLNCSDSAYFRRL